MKEVILCESDVNHRMYENLYRFMNNSFHIHKISSKREITGKIGQKIFVCIFHAAYQSSCVWWLLDCIQNQKSIITSTYKYIKLNLPENFLSKIFLVLGCHPRWEEGFIRLNSLECACQVISIHLAHGTQHITEAAQAVSWWVTWWNKHKKNLWWSSYYNYYRFFLTAVVIGRYINYRSF